MGDVRAHPPVLLLLAVFSRRPQAMRWATERAQQHWGPIALSSPRFDFTQTDFYERSMGTELKKQFHVFERLRDPGELPSIKLQTNAWEAEYAEQARDHGWPEPRPLNLDPGYLTEAKLVLASTKDRDHRLYLDRGIYCEGTLYYQKGQWRTRPWTYPDYQTREYHEFFDQCREYLRQRLR